MAKDAEASTVTQELHRLSKKLVKTTFSESALCKLELGPNYSVRNLLAKIEPRKSVFRTVFRGALRAFMLSDISNYIQNRGRIVQIFTYVGEEWMITTAEMSVYPENQRL